jgi:hypothetical protein
VSATIDVYLAFREELRTALRRMTPSALRRVLVKWADPRDAELVRLIDLSDEATEPIIRRMILEEPRLADLHAAARLWLASRDAAPAGATGSGPTSTDRAATSRGAIADD